MNEQHSEEHFPGPPEWQGTPDAYYAFMYVYDEARQLVDSLAETRMRQVRHNRQLERAALWHAITLGIGCRDIVARNEVEAAIPLTLDRASRYDLRAAMRFVPDIIPLTHDELDGIQMGELLQNYEFRHTEGLADRRTELVERWHGWLWTEAPLTDGGDDHGDASLLSEASSRLTDVLNRTLFVGSR